MAEISTKQHRTQAERRERTRTKLLDAAISELTQKGYAGFRVEKVAAVAAVSRGAQTYHFPTKESLVLGALEKLYQATTEASRELIASLKPGDDVFDALMKDSANFYFGSNFFVALSMLNLGDYEPELKQKVCDISREFRLPIEESWHDALLRSGLPDDAARTVLNITQSVHRGMLIRSFLREDPEYVRFTTEQWATIGRTYIDTLMRSR